MLERMRKMLAGVRTLGEEFRALQTDLEQARAQRAALDRQPRPKDCLLAAVEQHVSERYRPAFDAAVAKIVTAIQGSPCTSLAAYSGGVHSMLTPLLQGDALAHLLASALSTEIRRAVGAMPWPADVAPAMGERKKAMAALDAKIADLTGQVAAVRAEADAAGVLLGDLT